MSFVKIMIHAVWGTKNREPILTPEVKKEVISHIRENAIGKKISIDEINGHLNHLHCLFELNADTTLMKALQLMKGESSHWVNKVNLIPSKFEWADEYFAASVSESQLNRIRAYIRNQEEHHKTISFMDEYNAFLKKYGRGD